MENAKIRVKSGIKINVNDDGDCIVANVNDNIFVEKFYNLVEKIEKLSKEVKQVDVNQDNLESGKAYVDLVKEKTSVIAEEIDNLFGEKACEKVFGKGVSPTGYAIADFFDQLVPIFEKYANERQKKIASKYNKTRKGNR